MTKNKRPFTIRVNGRLFMRIYERKSVYLKTTKEEILMVSVRLFAERGFDAVSTSMIAGELGITKGALYRHFKNKQEIFDSLIDRMFELDSERAVEDNVSDNMTNLEDFCEFVNNQFVFWTENEFVKSFRRMITLEQFKSPEMNKIYQDMIALGPVNYSATILEGMMKEGMLVKEAEEIGAERLAVLLYAPLQLMIQLSDGGESQSKLKEELRAITTEFENRWRKKDNE